MVSVKATLHDNTQKNASLIRRFERDIPYVYRRLYYANARVMSPKITGRLIKSIGSQILGDKLTIVWRADYAGAVDKGGHTDKTTHWAPAMGYGRNGKGYMATAGTFHPYTTGSKGFANRISRKTNADMGLYVRSKKP